MAFVAVATSVGAAVLGTGAAAGIGSTIVGGIILGAGAGGLYSAITGDGNVLNSMLTGGLIGGAGAGGLSAMGVGAPAAGGTAATIGPTATAVNTSVPALTGASTPAGAILANASADPILAASNLSGMTAADIAAASNTAKDVATTALTGKEVLGYGLAGTAAMKLLGGRQQGGLAPASATDPGMIRPYQFSSNPVAATGQYPSPYATAKYDAAGMPIMDTRERNYFDQKYTALTPYSARVGTENPNKPIGAANGGLMAIGGPVEQMSRNVMGGQGNMFPQSQQEHTNFATPTQMPTSAEVVRSDYDARTQPFTGVMMANGGKTRAKSDEEFSFDDLTKAQKQYYLDLMASPMKGEMPLGSNVGSENTFEKYMMSQAPQGFTGRVGAKRVNDDGSSLRAGLSGVAMAQPGKPGITALPGAYDVGYTSPRKSDEDSYLDLSAYRSINSVPGRGHDRGVNARYTIPFAGGGLSGLGFQGYGQPEEQAVGRKNPVGEFLVNQIFSTPAQPTAPVVGGSTLGSGSSPSSAPPNQAELNPILKAMYQKQTEKPDYEFTQPELISGWQSYNPNAFAYNPTAQKYSAATPNEQQLSSFKTQMADYMAQDRARKDAEQAAAQPSSDYGQAGGANGGLMPYDLGGYSDGGRLLRGPGDGVSDDIPATIAGKQPARLADGEFVIPARIVSEIGNGSTDAGAKRLYAMMDRIQAGRKKTIGKKNIAKDTKAKKHLLA